MIREERLPSDILSKLPAAEAVLVDPSAATAEEKVSLFEILSEAPGTDERDLVLLNGAPPSIVGRVLMDRRILVERDPHFRHRYESLMLREFFDFQLFERAHFAQRHADG